MARQWITAWATALAMTAVALEGLAQDTGGAATPQELFERRIMPIFRSPEPSSCVQCHLASVDLKNYILPSHEKTFLSLRDQGLIDLTAPEKSKILTLIRMGEEDLDPGARLIHEKTRQAEYEAFASWIQACCDDPKLRDLPPLDPSERARPPVADPVIRHARKSRVLDSFERLVWSQRMRCFPCHTPHELDPANPKHQAAFKTLRKLEQEYDAETLDRLAIFRQTPEETLRRLVESSRQTPADRLPAINLEDPEKSLLVLKPMSKPPAKREDGTFEAPSHVEPVTHGGGLKMHPGDPAYKAFVAWLNDYANVVQGRYRSPEELPADNWRGTEMVLRLASAPEAWPAETRVQMFVYPWDEQRAGWAPEPVAFTQGVVTPRRMVNGTLFLLASDKAAAAPGGQEAHTTLPPGKYLVKVYVDLQRRLDGDPTLLLDEEAFYGQVEIPRARWREGFLYAEQIRGSALQVQ